jgi:hypothetical protein
VAAVSRAKNPQKLGLLFSHSLFCRVSPSLKHISDIVLESELWWAGGLDGIDCPTCATPVRTVRRLKEGSWHEDEEKLAQRVFDGNTVYLDDKRVALVGGSDVVNYGDWCPQRGVLVYDSYDSTWHLKSDVPFPSQELFGAAIIQLSM